MGSVRINTEEFIRRAKSVHGDKYDYSLIDYKASNKEVDIICPIHGVFRKQPSAFLRYGCKHCSKFARRTKEVFIEIAEKIHGKGTYDYSKVVYTGNKNKVIIICPIHGEFSQRPNNHILIKQPQGCPECGDKKARDSKRRSFEEFKEKAIEAHGDKYSYDKVVYVSNLKKVIITCPVHGDFQQLPSDHWYGRGCRKCGYINNLSAFKRSEFIELCKGKLATFYVLKFELEGEEFIKIGLTSKTIKWRYEKDNKIPYTYTIIKQVQFTGAEVWDLELLNKRLLKPFRYTPKKEFAGHTECFTLDCLPFIKYKLD